MPGQTWRDLVDGTAPSVGGSSGQPAGLIPTGRASPRLTGLLEQREALEARLRGLVSGPDGAQDAREAARFQVPTFAERQAQQREWEAHRSALNARAAELRRQGGPADSNPRETTLRSPRDQAGQDNVNQWLSRRDSRRRSLREAARDRLSPLNDAARVGRQLDRSLSRATGSLRNLDRVMGEHDMGREGSLGNSPGRDSLERVSSQIGNYSRMAEAPMRAVRNIDRFWDERQRQISGAMDRNGSYFNRSRERLSTETGGSGDVFERMRQNRQHALQRREEQRRQEERDEARRERAIRNRREEN